MKVIFHLAWGLFLISCQATKVRNPASAREDVELVNLVNLIYEKDSIKAIPPLAVTPVKAPQILSPASADQGVPVNIEGAYKGLWRTKEEILTLNRLQDYELRDGQIERVFIMERFGAKDYRLEIINNVFQREGTKSFEKLREEQAALKAELSCNGEFQLKTSALPMRDYKAGETARFHLYDYRVNAQRVFLVPAAETQECQLRVIRGQKKYGVRILHDVKDADYSLNYKIDGCYLPKTSSLQGVERFFLSDKFKSMTCVDSVSEIQTLEDPIEALRSKVETLLGTPISKEYILNYDPLAPLDFSKAPHFDNIYVSYLVFRADFYGQLMARLLEYHAGRGTRVKILISDVITLPKDLVMFERLTQRQNNIKLQAFRYRRQKGESPKAKFDEIHRTMHVKLLITTSRARPEWNVTYLGGRNIHDGFVFKKPPAPAKYPDMVSYVEGDESFGHWRDFEVKIADPKFTQKAVAHYLTLWNYDTKTLEVRSVNQNLLQSVVADPGFFRTEKPLVRHYMSFPYKDNHSLEIFYSDLLDAAEKNIKIVTPYFRPTKMLSAALERAVRRGVDVTLITRLDLEGDTIDWLLSDANKEGVNRFSDKIKIYEYVEPKVILHSKIVLVDGKFSFVGSVNLNKRSFFHDLENGLMVYSSDFYRRMENIFEMYLKDTKRITEPLKVSPVKKVILDMFDTEF